MSHNRPDSWGFFVGEIMENIDYLNFVRQKIAMAKFGGFEVEPEEISPILKPHQHDIVRFSPRSDLASLSCRLKHCD